MSIVVNIYYTGRNGSARAFAAEMVSSGLVEQVRAEPGNERYEYYRRKRGVYAVGLLRRRIYVHAQCAAQARYKIAYHEVVERHR